MTPLMLKEGNPDFGFVIYNHKKTALPTQVEQSSYRINSDNWLFD